MLSIFLNTLGKSLSVIASPSDGLLHGRSIVKNRDSIKENHEDGNGKFSIVRLDYYRSLTTGNIFFSLHSKTYYWL